MSKSSSKKGIKKEIDEAKGILKKGKNELIDQVSYIITPEKKEWDIIRKLQKSGKLPKFLQQVFVYTKPRHYERGVYEMEHLKILETKLLRFPFHPPYYKEKVFHYTCYNPRKGRLHVLLKKGYSLEDLYGLLLSNALNDYNIFTPPKYL